MSQLSQVINLFFKILSWLIFARVLLSWLPHDPKSPLFRILYEGTEPLLAPFRKILPKGIYPLDLSPFFALLVLQIIRQAILMMF